MKTGDHILRLETLPSTLDRRGHTSHAMTAACSCGQWSATTAGAELAPLRWILRDAFASHFTSATACTDHKP